MRETGRANVAEIKRVNSMMAKAFFPTEASSGFRGSRQLQAGLRKTQDRRSVARPGSHWSLCLPSLPKEVWLFASGSPDRFLHFELPFRMCSLRKSHEAKTPAKRIKYNVFKRQNNHRHQIWLL